MKISSERMNGILVAVPEGRLDAFEAASLGKEIDTLLEEGDSYLVLDMAGVSYLSSGGIRVLLGTHKKLSKKNGRVCICSLQEFPAQVLKMVGIDSLFNKYDTAGEAVNNILIAENMKRCEKDWRNLPCYHRGNASFHIFHSSDRASRLKIVGNLMKVMHATLEPEDIRQRHFAEAEYSIGLGALGGSMEDCLPLLGEMMTIGGTMVWLPTDGNDTPDFLIPHKDTGEVVISAGLNLALDGEFNDIILVGNTEQSASITLGELYEAIFDIARERQTPHSKLVSVAMVADLDALYSSGVKISPISKFTPANRGMITDPENIAQWMDINTEPKFSGSTMISFGLGLDLTAGLSGLSGSVLDNVFYTHPANTVNKKMLLHNHGVVFENLEWGYVLNLDCEIRRIARQGDFVDMRHLLDGTRVTRAIAGVSYITDILPE
jgi:anti-anti-sigma factor